MLQRRVYALFVGLIIHFDWGYDAPPSLITTQVALLDEHMLLVGLPIDGLRRVLREQTIAELATF